MMTRQRSLRRILLASTVTAAALCLAGQAHAQAQAGPVHVMKPRGASTAATSSSENLIDHGGPVLPNSTTYAIWWGNPSDFPPDAQARIDSLLQGFDGSDYLAIANQYMRGATAHTRFGGNLYDTTPPTTNTNPKGNLQEVGYEVCRILHTQDLTPDPTGIYFVFTSNFPNQGVFCAYHGSGTCTGGASGVPVRIAYIPNSTDVEECNSMAVDPLLEPNSYSQGTQAVANITSHEFMETVTDPLGNAWYSSLFNEIGDNCLYLFQSAVPLTNSSQWKIQEEWSNQQSGCDQGAGFEVQVLGAFSNSGTISTFNVPGATYGTLGLSINKNGAIAGITQVDDPNISAPGNRAFVRDPSGALSTFDAPGANDETDTSGINGVGATTGFYTDASSVTHGFVRDPSGILTTFDASGAQGTLTLPQSINDQRVIAGDYLDSTGLYHGFVRDQNGTITTFDAPGAAGTATTGTITWSINGSNAIAGHYSDASAVNHGFVRDPYGSISTIDAPGAGTAAGQGTQARGINGVGAIAGYYTDANSLNHGFVRDQYGKFTTFDAPGAAHGTFALSINAAGAVAGYYSDSSGLPHAFVRTSSGAFSTPKAPGASYGTVARSINDLGAIAGYATTPIK